MEIKKILVANRGEIAIRVFRAAVELGIRTVAVYTFEDRYSLHRYKADEAYQIGNDNEPLKPYLDAEEIIKLAIKCKCDAIHPGYGFLSENAQFAQLCADNNIIFIGPSPSAMIALGDKVSGKKIAMEQGVPIIESSLKQLSSVEIALSEATRIGFPVMLKAAAGGGGRGMRVLRRPEDVSNAWEEARREAKNAFGDDTVFIEKYVERPKHIEVQIAADKHGNRVHLFERDCSVQRRFQKVVEVAPAPGLKQEIKDKLYAYALKICAAVNYDNVGTVEFLVDSENRIYFIEVNPRIQVEHTVTEMITNIDLVKIQIRVAMGHTLSEGEIGISGQESIKYSGYAIQCRITAEDPENDFKPDYGTVTAYRSAGGFGIRLDVGSVYPGVRIPPYFDSLLVKVSAHSRTMEGAARKMTRTLQEFRVRGVKTNIQFLENIVNHPDFIGGRSNVNFIAEHKELFRFRKRADRGTKIMKYIGELVVNGHPEVKVKDATRKFHKPIVPPYDPYMPFPKGYKQVLAEHGPHHLMELIKKENRILYTDTTFRDAHQSLLATRLRSYDMLKVAESFAKNHPQVFSMEVWGGATFDVALRFLHENPWDRLRKLRVAMPNMLLQMLIRGANGVGYSSYPSNLVERFVIESYENGIDIFRIFDSLNWTKSLAACIEFVRKNTNGIAEGALCYTGDILDKKRSKYNLQYYIQLAKDIENAGAHMLAIKDMAGLLKPYAATELISALKANVSIPIHLHTHDTSSLQTATYLKAIEAGVDIIDVALGGLSGLTSQPNFNSVVEMMRFQPRENPINTESLHKFSSYFETVRDYYYPFEGGLKAGSAEVFLHEIPGGQYTNLKPQAEALGLGDKFEEIKQMFREVNDLFGDIIKVTPSSKVVGDMAQYLVANGLTVKDVLEKGETISFPESVVSFFKGDIGQPHGGFPEKLQKIILKNQQANEKHPFDYLPPLNIESDWEVFKSKFDSTLEFTDYLSWKMFPKVFEEYYAFRKEFGDVSILPTKIFFFGLENREEATIDVTEGMSLLIRLMSVSEPDENGIRNVYFRMNGQTRNVEITDRKIKVSRIENKKVEPGNPEHIGAPLQGLLSKILVKKGQSVQKNEPLFVIEAMKMETTITAPTYLTITETHLKEGVLVNTDDLVLSGV